MQERYCEKCKKWVKTDNQLCPSCKSQTYEVRRITDPEEVRKYVNIRKPFKDMEEEIVEMVAKSGIFLESRSGVKDFCD